jgi:membrane-bound serine protease (ClpP class)
MNYELLAILLLVVGCGLIVAEVFIPSGGMILVMCVLSFVASIWCAYQAWWGESQGYFWTYLGGLVVIIPSVVVGIFRLVSETRVGDRILLAAPDLAEVTPYQAEAARLSQLIGKRGVTQTPLNPGGMVRIDGERLHAFSEGLLVDAGRTVEIIEVRGTRVLVRPVSESSDPDAAREVAAAEPFDSSVSSSDAPPLDFDVPQG